MTPRSVTMAVLCTLLIALAAGFGLAPSCSRQVGIDDGTPVDTEIMAFLSEARALHHQANMKEDSGDLAGAVSAMDRLVAARRPQPERKAGHPPGQPPAPEVEEVLADAYARLAELRLKQGELDPAAAAVKSGLEHVAEATYFRGHLVEVQGLVEEARGAQLADAGNAVEAARARERAIQLLEEVVKIQEQVIQRSLSKDGG